MYLVCRFVNHITKPQIFFQGAISDQQDEFQQLVLAVVQRGVIPDIKALQGEEFVSSSSLYSMLHLTVTILCKDLSWLQALSMKQQFCWGIIASCCAKIPISEKHLEWVLLYESVITCLSRIYNLYCTWKELPKDKCLLSADEYPQETVHSEDIKKYDATTCIMSFICHWYTHVHR